MAFTRPSLDDLVERVRADLRAELNITAILRRSFLSAIGRAVAGVAHTLHGHLKEISKQAFPDQATDVYLQRWGSIYGINQKAATFTQLAISGTGIDGSALAAGTVFQIDSGLTYEVDTSVTVGVGFPTGTYEATITAVTAGAGSNLANGETVVLQSPVAGIDTEAVVDSTIVEGEDVESESSQQERIVARIQFPPAGGKPTDYIAWARSVAGVTRAWVLPGNRGQGTVDVTFVEDDDTVTIIPSAPEVAAVQAYINTQKPVTADCIVFAPNQLVVNMTIQLSPNTAAVQAQVTAELEDLFFREAQIAGAVNPALIGIGGTYDGKILLSKINEAISIAAGEQDHLLVTPSADIEPLPNYLAVLGTITYQPLV